MKTTLMLLIALSGCSAYITDAGDAGASEQELGTPFPYTVLNSDSCSNLTSPAGSQAWSAAIYRAMRSFTMSIHAGQNCTSYSCASGNVSGTCTYRKDTTQKTFLDNCFFRGTSPQTMHCDFGVRQNGQRIQYGGVNVGQDGAVFFYNDGAQGEPNYQGNVFWYSPAN